MDLLDTHGHTSEAVAFARALQADMFREMQRHLDQLAQIAAARADDAIREMHAAQDQLLQNQREQARLQGLISKENSVDRVADLVLMMETMQISDLALSDQ